MSVLFLTFVSLMSVVIFASNPIQLSIVEARDPNFETCEAGFVAGFIAVAPTIDNLDTILNPCIVGTMSPGDTFVVKFYHLGEEVPELERSYEYTGTVTRIKVLKNELIKYKALSTTIQPSSDTAIVEIITAEVFMNGDSESIGEFTIELTRAVQQVGEAAHQFAVLSEKPRLRKHCLTDSSDISSVVSNGEPFYVCAIFYNPICPTDLFDESQTTFIIDVEGIDSIGLTVDLTPSNDLSDYTCGEELVSQTSTWRFVTIQDYADLVSINVLAEMDSYASTTSVSGSFTF